MSKYIVLFIATFCILFIATPSRSDVSPSPTPLVGTPAMSDMSEPITGTAIMPAPGAESGARDPFTPYGIGATNAAWKYSDLKPSEKAVADRGRDGSGWDSVHAAYATAVAEQAQRAAASSAQSQIGVENLAGVGVVR